MTLSAFPYPGGKTNYVDEIVTHFPEHRRYVEPFGGSAALLLNKPESYIEVYNDKNSDVVHFFETVRDRRDELKKWLRCTPFSRELHSRWTEEFFNGYRPEDDIERAGRWFYLRYTQFGGKLNGPSGFKASGKRNEALSFRGGIDELDAVVERLQEVTLENQDYSTVIERYDRENTLFYLDPPYVGPGDEIYRCEFDHAALLKQLADVDGYWVLSYSELPDAPVPRSLVGDLEFREFGASYSLHYTVDEGRREATERLVMNFNPRQTPGFSEAEQTTLVADGGSRNHRNVQPDTNRSENSE